MEGDPTSPSLRKSRGGSRDRDREPLRQRLICPIREAAGLVDTLLRRPGEFPAETLGLVRRGFRGVWAARGGGLYACGFFVTFVALETRTLFADLGEAAGVGEFFAGQLAEWLLRFTAESIQNTVHAFLWPLHVVGFKPPLGIIGLGIIGLGLAYLLFPAYLKEPLEGWLFGADPEADSDIEDTEQ